MNRKKKATTEENGNFNNYRFGPIKTPLNCIQKKVGSSLAIDINNKQFNYYAQD
jgi:hypothetical protein